MNQLSCKVAVKRLSILCWRHIEGRKGRGGQKRILAGVLDCPVESCLHLTWPRMQLLPPGHQAKSPSVLHLMPARERREQRAFPKISAALACSHSEHLWENWWGTGKERERASLNRTPRLHCCQEMMSDSSLSSFSSASFLCLRLSSFLVSFGSAEEDSLEKEERELYNAASPAAVSHVTFSSSL